MSARGQHFAVVTESNEIISGSTDGVCKVITDIPGTTSDQKHTPLGIYHHPVDEHIIFIFYSDEKSHRLIMQEISDGHSPIATLEYFPPETYYGVSDGVVKPIRISENCESLQVTVLCSLVITHEGEEVEMR